MYHPCVFPSVLTGEEAITKIVKALVLRFIAKYDLTTFRKCKVWRGSVLSVGITGRVTNNVCREACST